MDTTTPDGGASAQPQEPAAVTTGHNADQVITTDASGTPTMIPVTSQSESASAPASEAVSEETPTETQAPAEQTATDTSEPEDIKSWAEKKGLPLDDPVKLASMYRDAEKKMHEATQAARTVAPAPPEELPQIGDPNYDQIVSRLNRSEQMQYVTGLTPTPMQSHIETNCSK